MPRRIDQINKHIQRTFGEILQREADIPVGVMVTISSVETTKDLRMADVWLSVFPDERAETVVGDLRKQLYQLQGSLNRKLSMNPLPRITIKVDHGARHAENIERHLKKLAGQQGR